MGEPGYDLRHTNMLLLFVILGSVVNVTLFALRKNGVFSSLIPEFFSHMFTFLFTMVGLSLNSFGERSGYETKIKKLTKKLKMNLL